MKLPLKLDGQTIRDANGIVIVSALNPATVDERMEIVKAVNAYGIMRESLLGIEARSDWEKPSKRDCTLRENSTTTQKTESLSFGENAKKSGDCGAVAKALEEAKLKINRIKVPYAGTTYDENGYAVGGEPVDVVDADDALEILGSIEQAVADHFRDAAQMVCNAAKLREAAEAMSRFLLKHQPEGFLMDAGEQKVDVLDEFIEKSDRLDDALSMPVRNCDRPEIKTLSDAVKVCANECNPHDMAYSKDLCVAGWLLEPVSPVMQAGNRYYRREKEDGK